MSIKKMISLCVLFLTAWGVIQANDCGKPGDVMTKEQQQALTPDQAWERLVKGNERYINGSLCPKDLPAQIKATSKGQFPFAAIVSCLDSRLAPEFAFDQRIGDLFVARVAGNFMNDDILGSLEFAALTGVKVIVVLGHSSCGAVKGAVGEVNQGLLTTTLANINPAVRIAKELNTPGDLVQKVSDENVRLTMQMLRDRSLALRELLDSNKIKLVGAMYDLENGKVSLVKPR